MREIFDMLTGHYGTTTAPAARGASVKQLDLAFQREVLEGLHRPRKELPCKYFYDRRGSDLFEAITTTPEYYPTRTEMSLLKACSRTIGELIGEGASLVELGGCDTQKARMLLGALKNPLVYMPVDVSAQHLWSSAMQLQLDYPYLAVRPVNSDFTTLTELPEDGPWVHDQVTFMFFGSTLGNFDPVTSVKLLRRISSLTLRNLMVIGVDLKKDEAILNRAYNDATGFTAEFNLNILLRINRELDADFDLGAFEHLAYWNEACGRVEMHLKSLKRQTVHVAGEAIAFDKGETIHTENSYKYTIGQFHRLVQRANYIPVKAWTDPDRMFSLHVLCKTGELYN